MSEGKVTCAAGALAKALAKACDAVDRRNTIPVLSNVLIEATGDRLTLTTTCLDRQVTVNVEARAESDLRTTVDANRLRQIASNADDSLSMSMEIQEGRLLVRSGRSRFRLHVLPPADFPIIKAIDSAVEFDISPEELGRLIARTRYAVSPNDPQIYRDSIHFFVRDGQLWAEATDGVRAARLGIPAPEGCERIPSTLIPSAAISILTKLIDGHDELIRLSIDGAKVKAAVGETTLVAKLADSTFPELDRVIPPTGDVAWGIDTGPAIDAAKRVRALAEDKTTAIRVTLAPDVATFSIASWQAGDAEDQVACQWEGAPTTIGFNGAYLAQSLEVVGGSARITLNVDPKKPARFDGAGSDEVHLLMPMSI